VLGMLSRKGSGEGEETPSGLQHPFAVPVSLPSVAAAGLAPQAGLVSRSAAVRCLAQRDPHLGALGRYW